MNELYVIVSQEEFGDLGQPLYWSNQFGWVPRDQADVFRPGLYQLPLGGKWERP